jgi:hypothetical protein
MSAFPAALIAGQATWRRSSHRRSGDIAHETARRLTAMIKRWFTSLRVFTVWLTGFVTGLILLALWHDLFMVFMVNTLHWGRALTYFMNLIYYVAAGLACVVYYILLQDFLSRAAGKGQLLRSSLLTIGIELLLIGLAHGALALYGFFPADRLTIGLTVTEVLSGGIMLFLAVRWKKPVPEITTEEKVC